VGDAVAVYGDQAQALIAYRASLAIRERLAEDDPSNATAQRDLFVSCTKLGSAEAQQQNAAEASGYFRRARDIIRSLADRDPSNAQWQQDLAWVQHRLEHLHVPSASERSRFASFVRRLLPSRFRD
jgi:uncharacterized membrane-anchored protein